MKAAASRPDLAAPRRAGGGGDNVAFGLKSLTRREAEAEAHAALERVGLAHYASEYPHILSGEEQQRVALACAIAPRPSVLLMDEPFLSLDPRLREKMREETFAILHETRATSIVVTHDAEEAMRMGDRVALMRAGAIVQTGTALDLCRAPKDILAARTFSDLNEVPARVEQRNAVTRSAVSSPMGFPTAPMPSSACASTACWLLAAGGVLACVQDARFLRDVALVNRYRRGSGIRGGKRGVGPFTISWSAACDGGAFTAIVP